MHAPHMWAFLTRELTVYGSEPRVSDWHRIRKAKKFYDHRRAEIAGRERWTFKRVRKASGISHFLLSIIPNCFGEWVQVSEWRSNPNFSDFPKAFLLAENPTRLYFQLRLSDSLLPISGLSFPLKFSTFLIFDFYFLVKLVKLVENVWIVVCLAAVKMCQVEKRI